MQCPLCNEWRSSRYWSGAQWTNWATDYEGCKICRAALLASYVPKTHLFLVELKKRVAALRRHADLIHDLIFQWMELPRVYRKKLTHLGAVRCTHPLHPAHYCCNHIGKCFDPGNAVYAMTLKAICPSLQQDNYNNETIGDICEAWLATGMRSEIPACRSLAVGVEGVAAVLYIVAMLKNVNTLQELDEVCKEYVLN